MRKILSVLVLVAFMLFSITALASADSDSVSFSVKTIDNHELFSLGFPENTNYKLDFPVLILNDGYANYNNNHEAADDLLTDRIGDKFISENETCLVIHVVSFIDGRRIKSNLDYQYRNQDFFGGGQKQITNKIWFSWSKAIQKQRVDVYDIVSYCVRDFKNALQFIPTEFSTQKVFSDYCNCNLENDLNDLNMETIPVLVLVGGKAFNEIYRQKYSNFKCYLLINIESDGDGYVIEYELHKEKFSKNYTDKVVVSEYDEKQIIINHIKSFVNIASHF